MASERVKNETLIVMVMMLRGIVNGMAISIVPADYEVSDTGW